MDRYYSPEPITLSQEVSLRLRQYSEQSLRDKMYLQRNLN